MSNKKKIVNVTNADDQQCCGCGEERFTLGYAYEVDGAGAIEVPEYNPTRHELIQLVKYWAKVVLEIDYDFFLTGGVDNDFRRLEPFGCCRINRIEELLGKKAVERAVNKVYAEFGEKLNKMDWDSFLRAKEEITKKNLLW